MEICRVWHIFIIAIEGVTFERISLPSDMVENVKHHSFSINQYSYLISILLSYKVNPKIEYIAIEITNALDVYGICVAKWLITSTSVEVEVKITLSDIGEF